MLYDSYHEKITKVLNTLRKIFKHIVLISIVTFLVVASVVTFMAVKGIVLDDKALSSSFEVTYGESMPLNSRALFASVTYEYSEDGATWSNESPIKPGEYKVRATAKNIFGQLRYGMMYDFVINPKAIDVSVAEDRIIYGEAPSVKAELAFEDEISCEKVVYGDRFASETTVTPDKESVKIKNADGEDVTENYEINVVETSILVNPRPITIIVSGKEMIYNDVKLSFDGYEISEDTPAVNGDFAQAVFDKYLVDVGEVENTPAELRMVTEDGADISMHYEITTKVGILKVAHRPLIIKTASQEKTYDEIELVNKTAEIVGEYPIVEGHTMVCVSNSSITNVGQIDNNLVFKIQNAAGEEKTSNYSLFYELGTLKVNPRKLNVSAEGQTWTYDGMMHYTTEDKIKLEGDGLCSKHKVSISVPEITDAGTMKNEVKITDIHNAVGESVLSNYEIIYGEFGDLVVNKRSVTFKVYYVSYNYASYKDRIQGKTYDAQAIAPNRYKIINEDQNEWIYNHNIEPYYKSVGPDAGEYNFEMDLEQSKIYRSGIDATSNFDITFAEEKFVINQRPLTLRAINYYKDYDGIAVEYKGEYTYNDDSNAFSITDGYLVNGHTLTATVEGTQTDVGKSENKISNANIKDAQENDVTKNYLITYKNGEIEISKKTITIQAASAEKEYDGKPFNYDYDKLYTYGTEDFNEAFAITKGSLVDGNKISARISGDELKSDIGEYRTWIQTKDNESGAEIVITDADGKDVTKNYQINTVEGILKITKRILTLKAASGSKIYDGKAYSYEKNFMYSIEDNAFTISEGSLLDGHEIYATLADSYELLYAGKVTTNIRQTGGKADVFIENQEKADMLDFYEIRLESGTLEITPIIINASTGSAEKIYDATPLTNGEFEVSGDFLQGHTAIAEITGKQIEVGSSNNTIQIMIVEQNAGQQSERPELLCIDKNGDGDYLDEGEQAGGYIVKYTLGTLTVKERGIYISLIPEKNGKVEKEYDGTPIALTVDDFCGSKIEGIESSGFVSGHKMTVVSIIDVVDAGEYLISEILKKEGITIVDENGNDVTKNYLIEFSKTDKLIITPVKITITSGTPAEAFEYNGRPHTYKQYTIDPNGQSFMDSLGHSATVEITGSQTVEGKSDNTIGNVTILDENGKDVTENYDIVRNPGTLTVKKTVVATVSSKKSGYMYLKTKAYGNLMTDSQTGKTVFGPALENSDTRSFNHYSYNSYNSYTNVSYMLWPAVGWEEQNRSYNTVTVKNAEIYMLPYFMGFGNGYVRPLYSSEDYTQLINDNNYTDPYTVPYYAYSFEDDGIDALGSSAISTVYTNWVKENYLNVDSTDTDELIYAFLDFYGVWDNYFDRIIQEYPYAENYLNNNFPTDEPYYGSASAKAFISKISRFLKSYLSVDFNILDVVSTEFETPESLINAVAVYIRSSASHNTDYSVEIDNAEDIANAFLKKGEGDAKHFATAATMLYRALNIPARYVEGYIVKIETTYRDTSVKDAHAWTEVFVEGYGWVYMEVTPGFGGKDAHNPIEITLKPGDIEHIYDGTEKLPEKVEIIDPTEELESLFGEDGPYEFKAVFGDGKTDVGEYISTIEDIKIIDKKTGKDVTYKFDITREEGNLNILKQPINIYLSKIEKFYDGMALEYDENSVKYYLRDNDFKEYMSNNGYELLVDIKFTDSPDIFDLTIANINDVILNPDTSEYSKYISISFRLIDKNTKALVDSGENYRLQIVPYDMANPDPMSDNIVAQIKPIEIEITAATEERYYEEGETLKNEGYSITKSQTGENLKDGLLIGHTIEVLVVGELTEVGTVDNCIESVVIYDENKNDVTANYNIKKINGKLQFLEGN